MNSDVQPYVSDTVDVSSDGVTWSNVFINDGSPITDASWSNYQYDISGVADNQSAVYVRWGYQVATGAFAFSGWNIDDIEFVGLPKFIVQVPSSATKGDGLLAGQGHVSISQPPATDLVVNLSSSDTSKVTVPSTVTIHAGQTNASFDLTVGDNHLLDGTQVVTVTAAATNYSSGNGLITIYDNESATLSLSLPPSANEGDPPVQATLNSSAAPAADITVTMTSSDTNSVQPPATVVLPAGQTSVNFNVGIIGSTLISPDRTITLTAHIRNWTDGVANILIHYNKNTNLALSLPPQARQSNGTMTNAGLVSIAGFLSTNLFVSLASSNSVELTVPASVVIPAGLTSAVFNITVVDTGHSYGTLPVQVGSGASGFISAQAGISLTDDQTPPAPFDPRPVNLSTTNPANVQLAWNPGLGEGVERVANGGFESGTLTNWTVSPITNGGFILDNGTFNPPSGDGSTAPYAGNYSVIAYQQSAPGGSLMYQDIALPTNAASIVLSWVDRVRNFGAGFSSNQQFSVELRDTNNATLAVVFTNGASDPLLGNWTQRSADVSAWRGRTIRFAFIVNARVARLDVHLDNVSVRTSNLPAASYSVYFGTNPAPGPAQLLGATTNVFWPLPALTPLTTYYWQVVASRTSQATGPVWQFSSLSTLSATNLLIVAGYSGTTNAVFHLRLDYASPQTVSVDFTTADGSALAPGDYTATNGTLTFNPGQTNLSVPVLVQLDTNDQAVRIFYLDLSNPNSLSLATTQASGTIINAAAAPPTLMLIPDQNVVEESTLTFTNSATNTYLPNEPLIFSLDPGAPSGAAVNPTNGIFTWTPTESQGQNSYGLTLRVTDGATPPFLSAAQTFIVTVNELSNPPVVDPIPDFTVHAGSAVSFTAEASDPDVPPEVLTFSLDPGAPASAGIDSGSGAFSWTTTLGYVGTTNSITVRATDNDVPPTSGAASFTVTVLQPPQFGPLTFSGGHVQLTWSAISNQVYRVQYTTNLNTTWYSLPGDITATGPTCTKLDPFPLGPRSFYRVMVLP